MKVDVRLEKINRTIFFYMEVRELTKDQKEDYNTARWSIYIKYE